MISYIDAAYQAWNKGIIKTGSDYNIDTNNIQPSLNDEYYFVRKYYKSFWSLYILTFRIISFHNPIKEIRAFTKNLSIQKRNLYDSIYRYEDYNKFTNDHIKSEPSISVIIPTLNRYTYLKDILKDLELQDYKNFEVIIVDQSEPFENNFYLDFKLNLNVVQQIEKALWLARNSAIKKSNSDYILLSEDDVRIPFDYINNHLKCIEYFKCDISNGVFYPEGKSIPMEKSFFKYSDQFATGNTLIKKDIFKDVGLFDRQFEGQRGGDGEFGLRCYLAGYKMISNPLSYCEDVKAPIGGLRQMGSWDAFRPKKLFSPRPIPSINYYIRKYFGIKNAIINMVLSIPSSIIPYRFKRNKKLLIFGTFLFIIVSPIFLIPIIISWQRSNKLIKEGAKIEYPKF
jgi:glycosyltransferase involved in cell wall biosynthesis